MNELLLRRGDRVLRGLRHAELHHRLGLDLDLFAGLWVAADARLALRFYQASEARNHEHAVLLRLLDRRPREQVEEGCRLLVGQFKLLRKLGDKSCLGQCCCHSYVPPVSLSANRDSAGPSLEGLSSPHSTRSWEACVYAGLREPTAVNLASFESLCQQQKSGFHRFFAVFSDFIQVLPVFRAKCALTAAKTQVIQHGREFLTKSVGAPRASVNVENRVFYARPPESDYDSLHRKARRDFYFLREMKNRSLRSQLSLQNGDIDLRNRRSVLHSQRGSSP